MSRSRVSAEDLGQAEELALRGVDVAAEGEVDHAEDAVHGRADLVAHVGQELALGPAGGLGRLLGLLHRSFRSPTFGNLLCEGREDIDRSGHGSRRLWVRPVIGNDYPYAFGYLSGCLDHTPNLISTSRTALQLVADDTDLCEFPLEADERTRD